MSSRVGESISVTAKVTGRSIDKRGIDSYEVTFYVLGNPIAKEYFSVNQLERILKGEDKDKGSLYKLSTNIKFCSVS